MYSKRANFYKIRTADKWRQDKTRSNNWRPKDKNKNRNDKLKLGIINTPKDTNIDKKKKKLCQNNDVNSSSTERVDRNRSNE